MFQIKVGDFDTYIGTATLIDRRGYFITASHVFKARQEELHEPSQHFKLIKRESDSPEIIELKFERVIRNIVDESGAPLDLALIKVESDEVLSILNEVPLNLASFKAYEFSIIGYPIAQSERFEFHGNRFSHSAIPQNLFIVEAQHNEHGLSGSLAISDRGFAHGVLSGDPSSGADFPYAMPAGLKYGAAHPLAFTKTEFIINAIGSFLPETETSRNIISALKVNPNFVESLAGRTGLTSIDLIFIINFLLSEESEPLFQKLSGVQLGLLSNSLLGCNVSAHWTYKVLTAHNSLDKVSIEHQIELARVMEKEVFGSPQFDDKATRLDAAKDIRRIYQVALTNLNADRSFGLSDEFLSYAFFDAGRFASRPGEGSHTDDTEEAMQYFVQAATYEPDSIQTWRAITALLNANGERSAAAVISASLLQQRAVNENEFLEKVRYDLSWLAIRVSDEDTAEHPNSSMLVRVLNNLVKEGHPTPKSQKFDFVLSLEEKIAGLQELAKSTGDHRLEAENIPTLDLQHVRALRVGSGSRM